MHNDVNLDKSNRYYTVIHNDKTYQCDRVTNVIEATFPTPEYLKRWIVNCAIKDVLKELQHLPEDLITEETLKHLQVIGWYAHKKVSEQALDDGSQMHKAIDSGVGDSPISEAARACLRGYAEFVKEFIPVKITGELKVYDTGNLIAGTIDYIALSGKDKAKKKTLWIIDWKSSKQISRTYLIQVVIYKWMLQKFIKAYLQSPTKYSLAVQKIMDTIISACGRTPKIKCAVVRLNKAPKARILQETCIVSAKQEKAYLEEFKLMLKLHKLRKEECGQ